MASDTDLAFTPAWRLARLIRSRRVSPVELTRALLERIEALNPQLNAYLALAAEEATAKARLAEARLLAGDPLPPLHGLPVSVKDLFWVRGMPCTGGSLLYRDWVPDQDAAVVERLHRAGAIVIGKTNTPEFGLSATTENRLGDDCRNPWDPERTSGGSSGGAAASVAAGMGPLAIGSDGGGSIRIPAGLCGVFGFKPTYGTVPAHGGFGGMPMFSHVGPITRTVRDAVLLLNAIAGHDARDVRSRRTATRDFGGGLSRPLRGLRVGWSPDLGYAAAAPEVVQALIAAAGVFEEMGCVVEMAAPEIEEPFGAFGPVAAADAYTAFHALLEENADLLSEIPRRTLERGRSITGRVYSESLRRIEVMRARIEEFFEDYDLLLTPATSVPAFVCGQRPRVIAGVELGGLWGAFPFATPFNISGSPAASVPMGFSRDGLPLGLHVAGPHGQDRLVLRAAAAFERARPWADRRPAMAS